MKEEKILRQDGVRTDAGNDVEETKDDTVDTEGADSADAVDKGKSDADVNSADAKDADVNSADAKDADVSSADAKDADVSSADAKDADVSSADANAADTNAADAKDTDAKDADVSNADVKDTDANTTDIETKENDADGEDEENTGDEKPDFIVPVMFAVMAVIAAILAGCLIYSGTMNTKLISAAEVLKKDNQTLQQELNDQLGVEEPTTEPETATAETTDVPAEATEQPAEATPTQEAVPTDPATNLQAVDRNITDQLDQNSDGQETAAEGSTTETGTDASAEAQTEEKTITDPITGAEFVVYEESVNNQKFSFKYPGSWDGHAVFVKTENADKTILITCYETNQYAEYQNQTSTLTGEIFHILINQNVDYRASDNKQYLIGAKDGYYAYYEEPQTITYDYINHADYANDYKLVYDSQQKIWRSFSFL